MITLKNILANDEKAQLLRLYGHDLKNSANMISLYAGNSVARSGPLSSKTIPHLTNLFTTLGCMERLANCSDFRYELELKTSINDPIAKLNNLSKLYPFEIINNLPEDKKIEIFVPGLWVVISNLIRNAKKYGYELDSWEDTPGLFLNIETSLFPQNPSFVPEGANEYKKFIAFRVHDTGKGFKSQEIRDYKSYFTTLPENGKNGLGLYITGLVAKVLRAPVEIKSRPGDTTLSFYHPDYDFV